MKILWIKRDTHCAGCNGFAFDVRQRLLTLGHSITRIQEIEAIAGGVATYIDEEGFRYSSRPGWAHARDDAGFGLIIVSWRSTDTIQPAEFQRFFADKNIPCLVLKARQSCLDPQDEKTSLLTEVQLADNLALAADFLPGVS